MAEGGGVRTAVATREATMGAYAVDGRDRLGVKRDRIARLLLVLRVLEANRDGLRPGDRYGDLGFRLAAGQLASGESGAPGGADGRRDDDQAEPTRRGAGGKKQGKESRKKKSALERLGDLFK